jgi:hypothetical protein
MLRKSIKEWDSIYRTIGKTYMDCNNTSTSDYLQEWSRKLKAFNRMVKVKRLFAKK